MGGTIAIRPLETFVEIYKNDYATLRAIAYNILKNKDDADDIMQSVMIKLVEKQNDLHRVTSPRAFLRRCIRNEAVSLWRHKKIAAVPVGDDIISIVPTHDDPDLERVENLAYIKIYIKKQPEEIQEAFISYVLDGYKIVDLAQELGMPPQRLERIFRRVRVEMCKKPGVRLTTFIIVIC